MPLRWKRRLFQADQYPRRGCSSLGLQIYLLLLIVIFASSTTPLMFAYSVRDFNAVAAPTTWKSSVPQRSPRTHTLHECQQAVGARFPPPSLKGVNYISPNLSLAGNESLSETSDPPKYARFTDRFHARSYAPASVRSPAEPALRMQSPGHGRSGGIRCGQEQTAASRGHW
jgi:hypothetical protein